MEVANFNWLVRSLIINYNRRVTFILYGYDVIKIEHYFHRNNRAISLDPKCYS